MLVPRREPPVIRVTDCAPSQSEQWERGNVQPRSQDGGGKVVQRGHRRGYARSNNGRHYRGSAPTQRANGEWCAQVGNGCVHRYGGHHGTNGGLYASYYAILLGLGRAARGTLLVTFICASQVPCLTVRFVSRLRSSRRSTSLPVAKFV